MSLQCKKPTSLVVPTVGCWRAILTSSQDTAAVPALGFPCKLDAALMLMFTLFLQVTGADWLWPMLLLKVSKLRLVAVYAPNIAADRVPFFHRLSPFLDDTKRLVLMGDWNAIPDPKIDNVGRGASRLGKCESSLVGLMTRHDLVDRFRLDMDVARSLALCQSGFLLGQSVG